MQVIRLAHERGWLVAHFKPAFRAGHYATHMAGDTGFPDLVLARGGAVHHWELKSERGVVSKEQQAWLAALGGRVVRPSDWEYIERVLA